MTPPRILLLLNSQDLLSWAQQLCDKLTSQFSLTDTELRSAHVSTQRFLSDDDKPLLLVVLKDSANAVTPDFANEPFPCLSFQTSLDTPDTAALQIAKVCSLASPRIRRCLKTMAHNTEQKYLIEDVQLRTQSLSYAGKLANCFDEAMQITGDKIQCTVAERKSGKVRDRYEGTSKLALVTTDRQSGFDRQLAVVPYKGAVLNLTSAYWFDQTSDIIGNHLLRVPHPNISIVKKCKPFPIEFVVRAYLTGSTDTSIWKHYEQGVRNYCGHVLPEGMTKNERLWQNLLTPTTKEEEHDRPIAASDIITEGWMTQQDWDVCEKAALAVFARGQAIAAEHGLILVDTKYEFGKDLETGEILLIDEVHTPDSSRWWLASNYDECMALGKEPDNISKEFLRLWYREHCNPYEDSEIPDAPRDLVLELARRYICLYEIITWQDFKFDETSEEDMGKILEEHLG
jgi:phosphoribosylaminoimidazole-succinocarboxamide synthase